MPLKKKTLSQQAQDNAQVTKGTSKNQEVIKAGIPNDHSRKLDRTHRTVGVSIGSTLNMGDYQSLRTDVWLSDEVAEGETVEQAYERVTKVVTDTLNEIVNSFSD